MGTIEFTSRLYDWRGFDPIGLPTERGPTQSRAISVAFALDAAAILPGDAPGLFGSNPYRPISTVAPVAHALGASVIFLGNLLFEYGSNPRIPYSSRPQSRILGTRPEYSTWAARRIR